jgi:hypothetical protein
MRTHAACAAIVPLLDAPSANTAVAIKVEEDGSGGYVRLPSMGWD